MIDNRDDLLKLTPMEDYQEPDDVTDEDLAEARQWLKENLIERTQRFIQHLQEEGIID